MDDKLHIISYSGGMGSFAEAKSCCDKYGPENVLCIFADVHMEDPDTYRFIFETLEFLKCRSHYISQNKNPWELFKEKRFIGNTRVDICSSQLKRNPINNFIKENFCTSFKEMTYHRNKPATYETRWKSDIAEIHLGIDYSEYHRLQETQKIMRPLIYRSTLVEEGRIIPKDYSEQFGIKKPALYNLGFPHNNCGGFCVKAGLGQFKMLWEKLPERYAWHEQQEQETLALGGLPFLKIRRKDKPTRYISLKEYREEFLETNKAEEDTFDIGGCGCALPV